MFTENWDDPNSNASPPITEAMFDNASSKTFKSKRWGFGHKEDNFSWRSSNKQGFTRPESTLSRSNRTVMKVENSKIGKLIGRQGSKIKELQEITNTRIKVAEYYQDSNDLREVIIFGDENSQKECQKLIEELVTERRCIIEYGPFVEEPIVIDWDTINALADKAESERWADCPPLKKNFYIEHPDIAKMSDKEVQDFRREQNNIVVNYVFGGSDKILNPIKTFEQAFQHYPDILREIKKQGFKDPSPIQCQAWPILLSGKDLIGVAQTGTGKTLAFLLPALIHIDGQDIPRCERGGANVLIIAPTRELALQIEKEVEKYSYKGIKSVCVYGGGDRRQQVKVVKSGIEIIIATPGRLNDLIEARVINLKSITYLVLDEADRMLDMGFEPQIRKVLLSIRPDRQSVMTSATWPSKVQRLAEKYMCNPVQVYIGSLDLTAAHSVTQTILVVKNEEKDDYLFDFIRNLSADDKVIVFVSKKSTADDLSCDLSLERILCQSIHGDREQIDREQALDDIKSGAVKILIATDVASRGIDISDITKVFNYDFPRNIEEYVHRVGRTGRAGKKGEAITLFTRGDWAFAGELITIMEEAEQPVPQELYNMRDKFLYMQQQNNRLGRPNRGKGRRKFVLDFD